MSRIKAYIITGAAGLFGTCGIAFFVFRSLADWDFYYRITTATFSNESFGLDYEKGPVLTRFVATNKWILFTPPVLLFVALMKARRKSVAFVFRATCATALVILTIGYLTAYLSVAKPDWWGDQQPEWLVDEAKAFQTSEPESGRREILTPASHTTGHTDS